MKGRGEGHFPPLPSFPSFSHAFSPRLSYLPSSSSFFISLPSFSSPLSSFSSLSIHLPLPFPPLALSTLIPPPPYLPSHINLPPLLLLLPPLLHHLPSLPRPPSPCPSPSSSTSYARSFVLINPDYRIKQRRRPKGSCCSTLAPAGGAALASPPSRSLYTVGRFIWKVYT